MKRSAAEILREYGPFPGIAGVHGVTFDGRHVWFASGDRLNAFDPASGKTARSIDIAADAGTAFDGQHLFQIAGDRIQKIDPKTGHVLATIPAPGGGGASGLAWAEGTLWMGRYRDRKIHQIDPETGTILRTIESNRFVTGVTWVDGGLWHGASEGGKSGLRRIDPRTGEVVESLEMPLGADVSGLECDGGDRFFCGGGSSGKVGPSAGPGETPSCAARRLRRMRAPARYSGFRPITRSGSGPPGSTLSGRWRDAPPPRRRFRSQCRPGRRKPRRPAKSALSDRALRPSRGSRATPSPPSRSPLGADTSALAKRGLPDRNTPAGGDCMA